MSPIIALSVLLCLAVTAAIPVGCPGTTTAKPTACPDLGTAAKYAVVAGAGVTNTGLSVIKGKLAVSPIAVTAITGFPPGIITQGIESDPDDSAQAHTDAISAYTYCKSVPYTKDLTTTDLTTLTLVPGVYNFDSTAIIPADGIWTFNGAGVYIIQVGSAVTTGAGVQMVLKNGAKAGCVFWAVGSSVTHGASSTFIGNILAYASSTFGASVTYKGSVYTQTGDVTLIDDTITHQASCTTC
jgi:hypothetical protein